MWNAYYYTGLYDVHLRNWLRFFPRKGFLVITLEDLVGDTRPTMDRITDHLGISSFATYPEFQKVNSYSKPGFKESTRQMLLERYIPHIRELQKMLGRDLSSWMK
jgi:hypothetical protein